MPNKVLLFFILSSVILKIQAQSDTIVFVNGNKQAAKIIEITDKKVKYKNPKDTLGPTFVIPRKSVERFIRKDGCFDIEDKGFVNCVRDPNFDVIKNENFTRHIISWDPTQLISTHLKFSYDYITHNRKRAIGLFYDHGLRDYDDEYAYLWEKNDFTFRPLNIFNGGFYKLNSLGLEFKLFPFPHKKIVYWFGFGLETGKLGNRVDPNKYVDGVTFLNGQHASTSLSNSHTNNAVISYYKEAYAGAYLNNGFLWRPTKHFTIQGNLSLGMNFVRLSENNNSVINVLSLGSGLHLGYAF